MNIIGAAMNKMNDAVPNSPNKTLNPSGIKCHIKEKVDGGFALNLGGLVNFKEDVVENSRCIDN